ncbi:MAG TPA: hypothetical protein VGB85_02630 [Nannocystis sp.]|jgi:hypothetical protein
MTFSLSALVPASLVKLLPALLVPTLMAVASTAQAGLDITYGYTSAMTQTTNGFDYYVEAEGTFTSANGTRDTSLSMDCSVNTILESSACIGTMTLGTVTINISNGFDGVTGMVETSMPSNLPPSLDIVHDFWMRDTMPHFHYFPGLEAIDIVVNGQIRHWFYVSSWADEVANYTDFDPNAIWK